MKLLIVTQSVDTQNSSLGFFVHWIDAFAQNVKCVTVICLLRGVYTPPNNVRVFSLGKERDGHKHLRRMLYVIRFVQIAWRERAAYDTVFVHMNQEYILLCGILWKLLGKKILLWRNHPVGNLFTRLAITLSDQVFCVSPQSYTAQFSKTCLMPAGVDTNFFCPHLNNKRLQRSILFVGRMTQIKHPDTLVMACTALWNEGVKFYATFVGSVDKNYRAYFKTMRDEMLHLEQAGVATFHDSVAPPYMPALYNSYEICINLTDEGSFDKTVIEAMACGTIPLVSNKSFVSTIPTEYRDMLFFRTNDVQDLTLKIRALFELSTDELTKMQNAVRLAVIKKHNIETLMHEFKICYTKKNARAQL